MARQLVSSKKQATTKEFVGVRVVTPGKNNDKRVGKVYRFVFHPTEKRIVGFMVKRPDLLLMFHRKDSFVALDGFRVEDGRVVINDEPAASGTAAIKRLGLDWDRCVFWTGMPILTEAGQLLGYVGSATFDRTTGAVSSIEVDAGVANDAIVGKRVIPSAMIKGFKQGIGEQYFQESSDDDKPFDETIALGAILVADEASSVGTTGGVASAAGEATAVAVDKARKAVSDAKPQVNDAAKTVGKAAGKTVDKGVFALGKQLGRASGMFSAFKDEYNKARKDD